MLHRRARCVRPHEGRVEAASCAAARDQLMRIAQPHAVRVALSDGRSVSGIAGADTRPRCVSTCALADRRPALTVVEAAAYGCRGALLVTTPRVIAHELHWASIDGEGMRVNRVDGRRRRRRRRRRSWRLRGIAIAHVADVPRAARKQLWLNFDGMSRMRERPQMEAACTQAVCMRTVIFRL